MSLNDLGTWAQVGSAALAAAALVISLASVRAAHRAVRVSQAQGWEYLGAQTCSAYRQEMLRLHHLGMGREEIKEWFRKEAGGQYNPYNHEGAATAYDAFAEGCGSVDELLDLLPTEGQQPTQSGCSSCRTPTSG